MRLFILFVTIAAAALGEGGRVAAISHRGEHLKHPENTIPAYNAAIDAGADFIETDVRTTSGGRLVIMHDGNVDRCTNGHGEVSKMTFDEIRRLDAGVKTGEKFAGTRVPTFEEVLELARGRVKIYVDAKNVAAAPLIAAIEQYGMEDNVVVYGSFALLQDIYARRPRIKVMPESVSGVVIRKLIEALQPKVIAFSGRDFTPEIVGIAKGAGADVFVDRQGSTDLPAAWQEAIDLGATGIQTDRPRELVEYLRSRGYHK